MLTIQELYAEIDRLPASEKWQVVKHTLDVLEHEQNASQAPSDSDYQQFLRETYGSLRDTPIER